MAATVQPANGTYPVATTSVSGGSPTTHAGAPSSGSKLYADDYAVIVAQDQLAKLTNTPGTDWHALTAAQNVYNDKLNAYATDLQSDIALQLSSFTNAQGMSGSGGNHPDPNVGKQFTDAEAWDKDQLANLATYYKQPYFGDQNAHSSSVARTSGTAFPGGGQGDVYQAWYDKNGGVVNGVAVSDPSHLPSGYVSAPSINANTNIADVYKNLQPAQAAYLGWSIEQASEHKQVNIPPEDVQSWNLLAAYAVSSNHYLKSGSGAPLVSSANLTLSDTSTDALVASSYFGNKPTDPGTWIGIAFGVAGAFLPLGGLGDLGDIAGEAADAASFAGKGVASVGDSGLVDATTDLATLPDGTVPVNPLEVSQDSLSEITATPEATTSQAAQLNGIPKSSTFNDTFAAAMRTLMMKDVGPIADDPAYKALLAAPENEGGGAIGHDYASRFGLSQDELTDIESYTGMNFKNGPNLTSGLNKLPKIGGDSFRTTDLNQATIDKIASGQSLTVGDLTNGSNILATKVGGYADGFSGNAKIVVEADSTADGGTWIAPLSTYGLSENESVFYNGTFSVEGTTQDASGEYTIYLKHHA